MAEGGDNRELGKRVDDETEASHGEWPALPDLELDVCVSDFVPGANVTDADTKDA